MIRSWISKAMIGAAVGAVAVAALIGTAALAADDGTVMTREFADRGPFIARKLQIRWNVVPDAGPPVQLPDDPGDKQFNSVAAIAEKSTVEGTAVAGLNLGGGVGLIAQATPQMRLEKSLKNLASDLR